MKRTSLALSSPSSPSLLDRLRRDQAPTAVQPPPPASSHGMWHGFIFPVAFVVSLFTDDIAVYAVPNNGAWYDFGYFVGIVFLGVGARSSKRR